MAITWITAAGKLGNTVTERIVLSIPIQAETGPVELSEDPRSINFSLIAGKLPRGLKLSTNTTTTSRTIIDTSDNNKTKRIYTTTGYIKGSPTEVRRLTESRFVIRANDGFDLEDRTFSIVVDGSDEPVWITKEGFLNVGTGKDYFVLDNSYVNFQLEAYDADVLAGDKLEYYLLPMGGELPPGLTLSSTGVISGFTDPIFALEYQTDTGGYDTGSFDTSPLDYAKNSSLGYDSYLYDLFDFDYGETPIVPRRLSRIYSFVVGVSDGINLVSRIFKIYVVTEEFLKADNTLVQVDTNLFTADNSNRREPIWITESNLGRIRANNYVTIFLDVYDPPSLEGVIAYFLLPTNPGKYKLKSTGEIISNGAYEISGINPFFPTSNRQTTDVDEWEVITPETNSVVPPGLILDSTTGELAGRVPYQDRVLKTYSFTLRAVNFPIPYTEDEFKTAELWDYTKVYQPYDVVIYRNSTYLCQKTNQNRVPNINEDFWVGGETGSDKTFTVEIIGEIESGINWITDSYLGSLKPNAASNLSVVAESLLYGGRVSYELTSGELPPGLSFLSNGLIIGKPKQFADSNGPGLTRFFDKCFIVEDLSGSFNIDDVATGITSGATAIITNVDLDNNVLFYKLLTGNFEIGESISVGSATATINEITLSYNTTFDIEANEVGETTTFDRRFEFTVKARDTARAVENYRTFYIDIITDTGKTYSNLYFKAFQDKSKRIEWFNFISDISIFDPKNIYRTTDTNFGVQSEIKMLAFAGIESVEAVKFVQAMSRNHYRKRLLFGDVKTAKARDILTQEVIYEVVYVEVVDEYEKNGKSISSVIELKDNINSKVLVSYDAITVDSGSQDLLNDWAFRVSDSDHQRIFPNSIKNMRNRIRYIGERDREFLPLWMRSIQDRAQYELGFTKALVLCYALPGKSAEIVSRIKASGFDFKQIDFVVDRYIIDILDNEIQDKYLMFPQRGEKRP